MFRHGLVEERSPRVERAASPDSVISDDSHDFRDGHHPGSASSFSSRSQSPESEPLSAGASPRGVVSSPVSPALSPVLPSVSLAASGIQLVPLPALPSAQPLKRNSLSVPPTVHAHLRVSRDRPHGQSKQYSVELDDKYRDSSRERDAVSGVGLGLEIRPSRRSSSLTGPQGVKVAVLYKEHKRSPGPAAVYHDRDREDEKLLRKQDSSSSLLPSSAFSYSPVSSKHSLLFYLLIFVVYTGMGRMGVLMAQKKAPITVVAGGCCLAGGREDPSDLPEGVLCVRVCD